MPISLRSFTTLKFDIYIKYNFDQMYVRIVTDLDAKIKSYGNWGHQISLSPSELFKPGPFCFQTKSNLLNINSLLLNTPIEKLDGGSDK